MQYAEPRAAEPQAAAKASVCQQRPTWSAVGVLAAIILALPVVLGGCGSLKKAADPKQTESLQSLLTAPKAPGTIGEGVLPIGMQPMVVTGVGAVNSLAGTGGAPDPSEIRDQLIDEMKRHSVPNCESFLELADTALVQVETTIPVGARRGDRVDVRVMCPDDARASDLAGGWLLDSRLHQQMRVRGGGLSGPSLRKGDCLLIATGPVTTDAAYEHSIDPSTKLKGRLIGGGQVQQDREIGLGLRKAFVHAKISSAMADAINDRFFFFDGNSRTGIATATTESRIDLKIPPRYEHSVQRLMAVINEIMISPKQRQSQDRLRTLSDELADPATAAGAAIRLEALGEAAVPVLLQRLETDDPAVRYHAAETLVYLDRYEGIKPLIEAIDSQPSRRAAAFLSLRDMEDPRVSDELSTLLGHASVETRYGAFVTLRQRRRLPSGIRSKSLGSFTMHRVASEDTDVEPVVVGSIHDRREIVLMGEDIPVQIKSFFRDRRGLVIKPSGEDRLTIERFVAEQPDRQVDCDADVHGLVESLARVGLSYGEVLTALQQIKDDDGIDAAMVIDPLPGQ